jgi:hypothetical protein
MNSSAFLWVRVVKITVLRSGSHQEKKGQYEVRMNTQYSKRFLGHIRDRGSFCSSCGEACISCRNMYDLDFSEFIAEVITFPAVLPVMLDDPGEYLPDSVKEHDILIAISIHEELLFSFVQYCTEAAGIVIPIEEPWWISPYMREKLENHCKNRGIEIAFPKPFCSFDPADGVLKTLKERFRIGRPEIRFEVKDKRIVESRVLCSAPCGATYFVAKNVRGVEVNDELVQTIDSLLSAYPCTASTEPDREFGDSIIHRAVQLQRSILKDLPMD